MPLLCNQIDMHKTLQPYFSSKASNEDAGNFRVGNTIKVSGNTIKVRKTLLEFFSCCSRSASLPVRRTVQVWIKLIIRECPYQAEKISKRDQGDINI